MNWLENSFIAYISTLVFYPYNHRQVAVDFIIKCIAVIYTFKLFPVIFAGSRAIVICNPVSSYARTASILHECDSVLINTHSGICQSNRSDILPCVLPFDKRRFIIQKCHKVSLGRF